MTLQERAEQLYPYRFPDKEEMLIEQYGTADDLKAYQRIFNTAEQLIKESKPVPESDIVRLQEIRTRAEHSFLEKTLRGDYELFKALVSLTVERYEPHSDLYQLQLPEPNPPEWKGFVFGLFLNCNLLAKAESFFGWDGVKNERGESFLYATLFDKAEQLYPGTREEIQERARQLTEWDRKAGFADQTGDDQVKKRYTMTIKPEYLPYPLDNVNHKIFEGLLMGLDPKTKKPHKVPMTAKKTGKGVSVYVSLSFGDANISTPLDINDYDMLNLVYSYMIAGNQSISLCRMLETYGEPRPTAKQLEEAYTRLYKLRSADITIDCKEWAKMKGKKAYSIYKRRILDGIAFEEIRKETNGELLDVLLHCTIAVSDLPLYRFAETCDQITQIPMQSAMITGDNSITSKTAAIRHMLLDRIIRHHNSDKSGKIALLDTIYEKINDTTKTEKNRTRNQIKNFMLEWVKNGTLYGFAFRKNGRTIDAVVFARTEKEMQEAEAENANLCEWYHR